MASPTTRRGNLPGDLTSFVGRRRELAEVRRLVGQVQLATLTGFGGVGKTRLALRAAASSGRAFRDGVWLVDLSPLRDPGLVPETVAAALGLRDEAAGRSQGGLAEVLRGKQLLVVLDNCEHLADACAKLAEELLRRARDVKILATSRQALGVPGERVFAVPPLPTPDPARPALSPSSLAAYDAVTLLVDRAQAMDPTFAVTADNIDAIATLVRRLDGIPLALELAAARLRMLAPDQLLRRFDDRYRLLSTAGRTAGHRQESLQAMIDWSFDLCDPAERHLWARLSVFPGDFDIEAVEAICADDELPGEQVLHTLSGLVDKSVVATARQDTVVRYRLLETLRDYGRRQLPGEAAEERLRRRHRDHYRGLAEQAWEEWFGPGQTAWTQWEQQEYVNLRAALEFCLSQPGEVAAGLAMVPALSSYWMVTGSIGEGRQFLDRALTAHPEPSAGRANALWVAAMLALDQGDLAGMEAAAEEARVLGEQYRDTRGWGGGLVFLGAAQVLRGQPRIAEQLFDQALRLAGDEPRVAVAALSRSGEAAGHRGDLAAATARFRECLAICARHGESWIRAGTLWSWALVAYRHRDLATAKEKALEALRLKRACQDRSAMAVCLEVLAWVASGESDHERAAQLLAAATSARAEVGTSLRPHLIPWHDRCETEVRRALGPRAFARCTRQGAQSTLDEAVSYALVEPADAARRPPVPETALTRREHEVAGLVAHGLSNREIAAKLLVSPRTAEAHVEHILVKLGFTSRAQIAAWVAERRTSV
jgi:predicted ATPase/DNA-binding CsgD family transcriptional regulator